MGTTQTRPRDAVDHLRTEEDMIAYLDAVLAESDPQLMIAALHDIARAQGKAAVAAAGLGGEGHRDGTLASQSPELQAATFFGWSMRLNAARNSLSDWRPQGVESTWQAMTG